MTRSRRTSPRRDSVKHPAGDWAAHRRGPHHVPHPERVGCLVPVRHLRPGAAGGALVRATDLLCWRVARNDRCPNGVNGEVGAGASADRAEGGHPCWTGRARRRQCVQRRGRGAGAECAATGAPCPRDRGSQVRLVGRARRTTRMDRREPGPRPGTSAAAASAWSPTRNLRRRSSGVRPARAQSRRFVPESGRRTGWVAVGCHFDAANSIHQVASKSV